MANSPKLDLYYLSEGQTGAETKVNHNANILESFAGGIEILDRDLTAPPGSPSNGDVYIPAATASGDWVGHEDELAIYYDGWLFVDPADIGVTVAFVEDEEIWIAYSSEEDEWHILQDNYTTTEQWTGSYYGTDKVYMKRVNVAALPNTTSQNTAHSISSLLKILDVSAVADDGTDQIDIGSGWDDAAGSGSNKIDFKITDTNIVIESNFNAASFAAEVTLKYTHG